MGSICSRIAEDEKDEAQRERERAVTRATVHQWLTLLDSIDGVIDAYENSSLSGLHNALEDLQDARLRIKA